jgi:prepilin-type N-terminal cleavage/methylation domain-containing protein
MTRLFTPGQSIGPAKRGFTLMEMLVVVAISGILAAMAAPSLVSVIESNRRITISNQLMEDLVFARRQAIAQSTSVALCGSHGTNPNACIPKAGSSADWSNGWYTYIGKSAGLTPASAAAGLVLRSPQALPSGWKVDAYLSDPGTYVYVDALSTTNKFGHFTIYRSGSTSRTAACVTVNTAGRARYSTATASVASGPVSSSVDPC